MGKSLIEFGKSIIIAIIVAVIIIMFVFETVSVDGTSMYSTLQNNDRLIIEKISYRFGFPKRGDIIVFKCPSDTTKKFIKRVIAVEGDKVKIVNDKVYVNGVKLNENYAYYMNQQVTDDPRVHDYALRTVPKDSVFVLGDNRYNSLDSRFEDEVGFVNKKLIIGREALRIYPFNKIGKVR
ncbi:signal peptidase I [Clostridium acetobutylicum]|uniref:Signal peptidase I n=1 Tax=Clostridium acetobutylicum (strain ATCC 824 / DSM 792 / JCM 1419 / IAM 19013 / LMG 5710 / NBRC 13948 / NRRL B-527 / VKM B-1787 / 2291 / W) TaxID=272562 RepID=Q97I92_CLOAB|nr:MULTISPECIES: signal peptidase I [Clostridium]AAK79726.1 Signal peptidase I [Clostridium acetobutylicum ATCC 824]ADZ20810.1 Signal peptidase I [Clostridium acetobutylicum EA 2018]AEI33683.1 Signal peptidase I [Clostridium acetobutylicum DSM 1731]AWV79839.1 signal peptidase I [Clostridium acetobutylicum]MBC2394177.1 signal peptidase I [Clostridium acetobutylicum]